MRFRKRYLVAVAIVFVMAFLKFRVGFDNFVNVDEFRGADIQSGILYPMIAQSINRNKINIVLNGKSYTNDVDGVYMDEQLNIMVPLRALSESLHCSAHFYGDKLIILQGNRKIEMEADSNVMKFNDTEVTISSSFAEEMGEIFVPLQPLMDRLSFSLKWDQEKSELIGYTYQNADLLPSKFDLREYMRTTAVRDQGDHGTCWAFAALSSLSSSLLPEEDIVFSPDHMSLRNAFSSDQDKGGEYTMGVAYLTSWMGPVYETDDPYGDGMSPNGLTAAKHVQEIQFIESGDVNDIKEAVFIYGGVQASIYMKSSSDAYYNRSECAYYYSGDNAVNHDIVIVGWDDDFPASAFPTAPEGNGAFICQNSWGSSFGMGGFFYVSYYDTKIKERCISYTKVEDKDNYDAIYQSDLCGFSGRLGYNRSSLYAANVYTSTHDEYLSAAGFYATGENTSYELYIVTPFDSVDSLGEGAGMLAASGKLDRAGYYTVKFSQMVQIKAGTKFAIILKIDTPGATRPLAVEYADENSDFNIDLLDGESYVSANGVKWEHAEEVQKCNVCLKVYTNYRRRGAGWKKK